MTEELAPGQITLVGLSERDLPALDQAEFADRGPILLLVHTRDINKVVKQYGNDPRIVQIIEAESPDLPPSGGTRLIREMIQSGRIQNAEIWLHSALKPLRFMAKIKTPDLPHTYPLYRQLRHFGFETICYRGPKWSVDIEPFPMLEQFVDRHKGERCFVVGNGPSLNKIDMSLLKNEITFGSNRVFLGFEKWGFEFTYWGMEDRLQVEEYLGEYEEGLSDSITKFVPFDYADYAKFPNACYFPLMYGNGRVFPDGISFPAFSNRPGMLYHGFTITYSLIEIAALMGCSEIYLIGVDHNYGLGAKKLSMSRAGGDDSTWSAADAGVATHFDTRYTTQNKKFVKPRPINAEVSYACSRQWCGMNGVEIKNATPGSHLDVYEMVPYEDLF